MIPQFLCSPGMGFGISFDRLLTDHQKTTVVCRGGGKCILLQLALNQRMNAADRIRVKVGSADNNIDSLDQSPGQTST